MFNLFKSNKSKPIFVCTKVFYKEAFYLWGGYFPREEVRLPIYKIEDLKTKEILKLYFLDKGKKHYFDVNAYTKEGVFVNI